MALTKKEQDSIIVSRAMRASAARRAATKIIAIVLFATLVLSGGAWGIMTIIDSNMMTISINNAKEGLTLSNDASFENPTTKLKIEGPDQMDAITYPWLRESDLIGKDGAHSSANYICHSFYLKNVSPTTACEYTFAVRFSKNTKGISQAVRIMVIESDEGCVNETESVRVFAQSRDDGVSEFVSYNDCVEEQNGLTLQTLNATSNLLKSNMTEAFLGDVKDEESGEDLGYYALRESGKRLSHDAYVKYTIVIWLEGTDLQCVNSILGGKCAIQFEFSIDEYLEVEYYGE